MLESKVEQRTITNYPPCALHIYRGKYIIVGTYELNKETGHRIGSINVYNEDLKLLKIYNTYGAVLDLKLSPFNDKLVATAHSTGNITIWELKETEKDIILTEVVNFVVFDSGVLISSLHFSPHDAKTVCVTSTSGEVALLNIATQDISLKFQIDRSSSYDGRAEVTPYEVQGENVSGIEAIVETFDEAHSLECWTAEFGQLQPFSQVLFTGGDDSCLMAHDLRSKQMIWSNNRIHDSGVVAIKSSTTTFRNDRPTSLVTGSYDDHIRSFDLRMLGDSIYPGRNVPVAELKSCNLGGGVWRFSEMPKAGSEDTLMVCCMYDGAKIVSMNDTNEEYFKVTNYLKEGHESMCYGGDWCNEFIATCSFYDKSLQKWKP
ncbi:hypothetical protein KAFR_0G03590 [Kazachstania africana CBS 2517]|uniref:methylated diphthine methylhydrolase n=1 Tax=Kazachstania africana (strain ATCC 22294 / BCRC 22015 / CBS 2517 / CECT 1963 / NBRC 1671 / NRRL Y-8276) TaxID=1071382 RepID=H2AYE1_KAZAF|nr:hypothetical protein KAFR_0G03590 [Kazachstania africana CBS 2517]CCF59391.1 hypothetical protein KAFR_0G03590 [Kazachstania africana CBS 2517]